AKAERPMVIVGGAGLKVLGAALALVPSLGLIKDGWNGFNVLHMAASRMGGLMLGYAQKGGIADLVAAKPKLAFFLGADEVDFGAFADSFKVY
ncbi:NADH-quinone oxidoreductase subunit G, partial [Pseudomonas sp. FW305-47B]